MRFTIPQIVRLVLYAAVAIGLAGSYASERYLQWPWWIEIPGYAVSICLAWAVLSHVVLPPSSQRFWFLFWAHGAAVVALIFAVGLVAAGFWQQLALNRQGLNGEQWIGVLLLCMTAALLAQGLRYLNRAMQRTRSPKSDTLLPGRPQPDRDYH
jgi:hypothetical protein